MEAHTIIKESNGYNYRINTKETDSRGQQTKVLSQPVITEVYMCAKVEVVGNNGKRKSGKLLGDIGRFVELALSGRLYEFVRDELELGEGVGGRNRAKKEMFGVVFSKHRNRGGLKPQLKKLFPELVGMIDAYKKAMKEERKKGQLEKGEEYDGLGDNQFAISLQKKESEVFIDKILVRLHRMGYKVLTKHDSVLCKKSELRAVKGVVKSVLNEVVGKGMYQLKEEVYSKD